MKVPAVQKNLIDRFVEYVSPSAAQRRMRARTSLALAGSWVGGSDNRRATRSWWTTGGSADADNLTDLPRLRERSRDLAKNNPIALGALNTVTTSTVGTGLMLRSRIERATLGMDEDTAQEWQQAAEREFRLWCEDAIACDAEATLDFYGLQSLVFRSALESGDALAVLPIEKRPGNIYGLKVQIIEADRVSNKGRVQDTDQLAGGVQKDGLGAPVAYHIQKRHPGGIWQTKQSEEWDVIPAFGKRSGRRNVIHLFDKRRPGQSRGMPYLAPVIEALRQLGDYTNAEITAAVVSGLFTVFVETESGTGIDIGADGLPTTSTPAGATDVVLGSGAIIDLAKGEKVSSANPGRPNTAFDPFVQAVLRQIGAALELPFELLIKHFTASYSAARASLLEAWRFFKGRREWLAAMFCQPIYEAVLEEAIASGRLVAPGFFKDPAIRAAYCGAEWQGDSPGQLDPQAEVGAAEKRLALMLTTRADETAALSGQDWEKVLERRAREEDLLKKAGLAPVAVSPDGAPASDADQDEDEEEGEDGTAPPPRDPRKPAPVEQ